MREIRIRDTLSGEPQPLDPRRPPRVGIYACGPTVYARIHVGNARPYVVPILLRRLLVHEGYEPTLAINITDVNDKIYDAAVRAGVPSAEYATEMIGLYVADTDRLGLGRPDAEPLATETIAEIVALIEALIGSGHAYESGGDVYFRVRSFDGYGKLSNRDPAEMDQGEEAGSDQLKGSPLDFALWKARKPGEDSFWPSPWGEGRPGWHIECSAMAEKLLGVDFEIHTGGSDLVFPHHENEIAQTEAARGKPLARIWMHNGMVRTAEEKMSKSVGNIFQLSEAIDRFGAEAVVAFLTSGHYRQPLEFSEAALEQASARLGRIRNYLAEAPADAAAGEAVPDLDPFVAEGRERFLAALADDFNTPRAWAAIFELVAEGNRRPLAGARAALAELLPLLGLESLLEPQSPAADDPEAVRLLAERELARAERDFERADRIRDELAARGWAVRDTADGARLVRAD
ncbi:MAG: cysteine--tRNA ligase [Solirubrobacterales bacterium]|nr:cysteine--tRNA ligase [Solirubrobacterales bacterium]